MGIKQDLIAAGGEFVGTTMFLFLALGGAKTAQNSATSSQLETAATVSLSQQTILFISLSFGFSLLVTAWIFYRITGGLFNPAVTLALWLIGGVPTLRACMLVVSQIAGGIAGAGLVAAMTPYGGVENTMTTLAEFVNIGQGLMIEAFLTAMLVFAVLMLAAEKHKATFIAPIGIGLVLFVCQLFGTLWTGCGMNPARAFGPSVISRDFPGYHWIYWVGPFIGSLIATGFYILLKLFDYGSVVLGQDSDDVQTAPNVAERLSNRFTHHQKKAMLAQGIHPDDIDAAERGLAPTASAMSDETAAAPIMSDRPVMSERKQSRVKPAPAISTSPASPRSDDASERTQDGFIRNVNPRYATSDASAEPVANLKPKKKHSHKPHLHRHRTGPQTGEAGQADGGMDAPGTHGPLGALTKKITGAAA